MVSTRAHWPRRSGSARSVCRREPLFILAKGVPRGSNWLRPRTPSRSPGSMFHPAPSSIYAISLGISSGCRFPTSSYVTIAGIKLTGRINFDCGKFEYGTLFEATVLRGQQLPSWRGDIVRRSVPALVPLIRRGGLPGSLRSRGTDESLPEDLRNTKRQGGARAGNGGSVIGRDGTLAGYRSQGRFRNHRGPCFSIGRARRHKGRGVDGFRPCAAFRTELQSVAMVRSRTVARLRPAGPLATQKSANGLSLHH